MSGEDEAFTLAVRAHSAELYRYAYWLCRDSANAQDLVQDGLLRAWRHWRDLRDGQALKAWLFGIVRNEFLRRASRDQRTQLELDAAEPLLADGRDMDDALTLRQTLLRAPVGMREVLVLQVLGGFSCAEIAELLSTSDGAVMTRLTRARQWLRRAFSDGEKKVRAT